MKIKDGFVVRKMAGTTVVIPTGADLDMDVMITLNDTGAFLWDALQEEKTVDELVQSVLTEYATDADTARDYIMQFIEKLKENGLLG